MARILSTLVLLLVVGAAPAHAKGGAVEAAEVCGADGCRPIDTVVQVEHVMGGVLSAALHGGQRIRPASDEPRYEVRIWTTTQGVGSAQGERLFQAPIGEPTKIDYVRSLSAVRVRGPRSKGHWARLEGPSAPALRQLTAGMAPLSGDPVDRPVTSREPAPAENGTVPAFVVGGIAMAVLGGWGVAARRRRDRR